ncbi:MAG TPA: acylneuraminate cytidylyltransferase family protein [Burkholderiales bacterium]|nr:acylneuraminate cytidylyltransferase family protein [Burkholderiales bacterium]
MATIATICARGGSRGVPGKNLRPLAGKPLIVHTIEQARACAALDAVYVSTDDARIAEVARAAGAEVPFLRPAELATAEAPKMPVIRHLVGELEKRSVKADRIVDLDPTSPLREIADIERCIEMLDAGTDVVITGYEAEKNPYFNMVEQAPDGFFRLVKQPPAQVHGRQGAPRVYSMNASIYVWHRRTLDRGLWEGRARLHVMPRERSIDIDSEIDFKLVELLFAERRGR